MTEIVGLQVFLTHVLSVMSRGEWLDDEQYEEGAWSAWDPYPLNLRHINCALCDVEASAEQSPRHRCQRTQVRTSFHASTACIVATRPRPDRSMLAVRHDAKAADTPPTPVIGTIRVATIRTNDLWYPKQVTGAMKFPPGLSSSSEDILTRSDQDSYWPPHQANGHRNTSLDYRKERRASR